MKDLIGIKVKLLVDGMKIEGTVVEDRSDRVMIRGADNVVMRVIKSHISMFTPEKEPEPFIPMQILCCQNKETGCKGVTFLTATEKLNNTEFNQFMGQCPRRSSTCSGGTKGDVRTCPSSVLKKVLGGLIIGDYPTAEKK